MKNFYIFRHGESTFNAVGRIQGCSNESVLTEKGVSQAKNIGDKLKDKNIEIIICSPLTRAKQTAEIANNKINVENVFVDNRFIEAKLGVIEGWTKDEVKKEYFDIYNAWWQPYDEKHGEVKFPGGESRYEVLTRVCCAMEDVAKNIKSENVAIASHGASLNYIISGLGFGNHDVPNAAIAHITYDNGKWGFKGFI